MPPCTKPLFEIPPASEEAWDHREAMRQVGIANGKKTEAYKLYLELRKRGAGARRANDAGPEGSYYQQTEVEA